MSTNKEIEQPNMKTKKQRGGVLYPFPGRLHKLLRDSECDPALACLISWNEDGTAFHVHDKKTFEKEIQPKYFDQSKYASFRRQLNLWSFKRFSNPGVYCNSFSNTKTLEGFYAHPLFKRDEPELCEMMQRSGATPAASISSKAKKSSKGKNEEDGTKEHVNETKSLSHDHLDTPGNRTSITPPQASTPNSSSSSILSLSNNYDGLMPFEGFPINSDNRPVNNESFFLQQMNSSKVHPDAPALNQDVSGQLKSNEIYLQSLLEETKRQHKEEENKKLRKVSSADDLLGLYHSLCNQKRAKRIEDEVQTKHPPHQINDVTKFRFMNSSYNTFSNGMASKTHLRRGRLSCNISKGDADYILRVLEEDEIEE